VPFFFSLGTLVIMEPIIDLEDPTRLLEVLENQQKEFNEHAKETQRKLNDINKRNTALVKLAKDEATQLIATEEQRFAMESAKWAGSLEQLKEEVRKYKENFEAEKAAMERVYAIQASKIKLDIGGHQFSTSRTTLTSPCEPDSMLNAMFSGRHQLHKDEDGSYFIDRDGRNFYYILNYLRDPINFEVPRDSQVKKELLKEAEYYCMANLIALLGKLKFVRVSDFDKNGVIYWLLSDAKKPPCSLSTTVTAACTFQKIQRQHQQMLFVPNIPSSQVEYDTDVLLQPPKGSKLITTPSHLVIDLGVPHFIMSGFTLQRSVKYTVLNLGFVLYGSRGPNQEWHEIGSFAADLKKKVKSWDVATKDSFQLFKFSTEARFHIDNVEFYGTLVL